MDLDENERDECVNEKYENVCVCYIFQSHSIVRRNVYYDFRMVCSSMFYVMQNDTFIEVLIMNIF